MPASLFIDLAPPWLMADTFQKATKPGLQDKSGLWVQPTWSWSLALPSGSPSPQVKLMYIFDAHIGDLASY